MENSDDIRLIVKIAQLYYEQDMTQAQIARELGIYRTTISRLLKRRPNITVYGPTDPGLIGGYGKNQVECRSTSMSLADLPAQTVFQNLNLEIITNKLTSEIR